jgi:hypothetical protein
MGADTAEGLTADQRVAIGHIREFEQRGGHGLWWYAPRPWMADDLENRVKCPENIYQGSSGLCGPAAVVRSWVEDDPYAYVRLATDLYDWGFGHFALGGSFGGQFLRPSAELRHSRRPTEDLLRTDPNTGKILEWTCCLMHVADWIVLASIRESFNWLCHITVHSTLLAYGTRPGTLVTWFQQLGYKHVADRLFDAVPFHGSKFDRMLEANRYLQARYHVVLSIDADMLHADKQDSDNSFLSRLAYSPNHFVVLCSPFAVTGDPNSSDATVDAEIWTWGSRRSLAEDPRGRPLKLESFYSNFYGFVAARF